MTSLNKTFLPAEEFEKRNWFIIDCTDKKIGRLATIVATLLRGKIKSHYYPSTDVGDFVILVNADQIVVNKNSKHYIVNNPGRPGHALKIKNVVDSLPKFTIERAVKGMLSKTEAKRFMGRLSIYSGSRHPYIEESPLPID